MLPNLSKKKKWAWSGLLFALIPVVGFCLFDFIPQALSLIMSTGDLKSTYISDITWTGLANYKTILTDKVFWKSIGNTFFFMLVPLCNIVAGLAVALLLSKKNLRGGSAYRTLCFLPYVCSLVSSAIMWKWIFDSDYGVLNSILEGVFGKSARVRWLDNPGTFRTAIIVMSVWGGYAYNMILFQSALAGVDESLYEAAELDGAGSVRKFFSITWPGISPTTFFMVTMGLIGGFQSFTVQQVWGELTGGPDQSGLTAVYYIYNMAFPFVTSMGMGLATAASWVLAAIILVVTRLNMKLDKFWVSYD